MTDPENVLLPHGGYEKLRSDKVAEAVYDATVVFCDRFIDKRSRTHDQMVQAARSGVRNISEGNGALGKDFVQERIDGLTPGSVCSWRRRSSGTSSGVRAEQQTSAAGSALPGSPAPDRDGILGAQSAPLAALTS